jgi:hypothetical protein
MLDPTNSRYRYLSFKSSEMYRRFTQRDKTLQSLGLVHDGQNLNMPAHGTYGGVLFSPQWKLKRQEIFKRDDYRCVICKSQKDLQVHHRQYHFMVKENRFKPPWDYSQNLLVTLCESCNKRGHNKYKVPTINI